MGPRSRPDTLRNIGIGDPGAIGKFRVWDPLTNLESGTPWEWESQTGRAQCMHVGVHVRSNFIFFYLFKSFDKIECYHKSCSEFRDGDPDPDPDPTYNNGFIKIIFILNKI